MYPQKQMLNELPYYKYIFIFLFGFVQVISHSDTLLAIQSSVDLEKDSTPFVGFSCELHPQTKLTHER